MVRRACHPSLFDPPAPTVPAATERARDTAVGRAGKHADPTWVRDATNAVKTVCQRQAEFTSDDLWRVLSAVGTVAAAEPRAMGHVLSWAAKQGWCRNTGRVRKSTRVENHARPVAVWESLIFRPEQPDQ